MALHRDSMERPLGTSLKATYRALLARGLEAGEAANLTAFLHGLPSDGFHWTLPEIEAIIRRRLAHAADERLAAATNNLAVPPRHGRRSTVHDRRSSRSGSTHVIDPPKP
jgi:predicted phage gp36 major capsid-like protein